MAVAVGSVVVSTAAPIADKTRTQLIISESNSQINLKQSN